MREHLELFARIKGMYGNSLERVVARKLDQLDLRDFEDKIAGSLSGGNKRKLSVAIATIGDPPILFLDEPVIYILICLFVRSFVRLLRQIIV